METAKGWRKRQIVEKQMNKLIGKDDTIKNCVPIGSIELKLAVARAEGYSIREDKTRYHHIVGDTVVTSVDETKPTYYYYNDNMLLPMFDPYRVAMEFYLREKQIKGEADD
jgi:hypothetical protein